MSAFPTANCAASWWPTASPHSSRHPLDRPRHRRPGHRALHLLSTQTWSSRRPLADRQRPSARLRTELVQDILQRMREGHIDEVAARATNVSLRTYRRHVAEIVHELDANSRFQAGARAVEYGLLPA
ncbi:hypothetical protein AB0I93_05760 [Streptomyces sp. NPDC049967]|uniref:hypothetical protein n=1 Tax=unclassified Streptomyces TaxID=2593676 RepID=UPI002E28DD9D|nr:hypothetical protein [Streptomyces sp. NBC_00342]